jgi:dTDP-glucose 4,6-dehydratase
MIINELGKDESYIRFVEDRKGHDFRYSLKCDKIKSLGWVPDHDFQTALKKTVKWYLDNEWWWSKLIKR